MTECVKCRYWQQEVQRQQGVIDVQLDRLAKASERISRLQAALRRVCDYAEECKHSPASASTPRRGRY